MENKEVIEKLENDLKEIKILAEDAKKNSFSAEEKANINARINTIDKNFNEFVAKQSEKLELPKEEMKKYSYINVIKAQKEGKKLEGIEGEFDKEMCKSMNIDTPEHGGFLAPTLYGAGIELMPQSKVVLSDLVTKINIANGSVLTLAKETAESSFSWTGSEEAGSEQQPTVGTITLTPKYYRAYAYVSNEAMKQVKADINLESFVRESLLRGQRKGIDRAILRGTSVNGQPKGILNYALSTVAIDGKPTFDDLDAMIAELEAQDLLEGKLAFVTHPSVAKILRQLKGEDGQYYISRKNNDGIAEFLGQKFLTSTNVTAANGVYPILFGDWSKVIAATFGALEIKVNDQAFTPWSKNQIVVGLFGNIDLNMINEKAIVNGTGATII